MKILGALVVTLFLIGCGRDNVGLVDLISGEGGGSEEVVDAGGGDPGTGGGIELGTGGSAGGSELGGGAGGGDVVVEEDAGVVEVDAGTPDPIDAGVEEVDAGEPTEWPGHSGENNRCDAGRGKKLGLIKHGKCE